MQPSLSPGVLTHQNASTTSLSPVFMLGAWPAPAPRMLHQLLHALRCSAAAPLRPVSMLNLGSHRMRARKCRCSVCAKLSSVVPPFPFVISLQGS